MNDLIEKYYTHWVEQKTSQEQDYLKDRVFLTIEQLFKDILKKDFKGRVLDLGCGDGSFTRVCQKRGINAVGIDIKDGVNFEFDVLPYSENSFDVVFMYALIEHLHDPSNILREIKRVLTAKGVVVVITPNLKYAGNSFYDDPTHVRPYTAISLNRLMNIYKFNKLFSGLWIVKRSSLIWKLPENLQFIYGSFLPFSGLKKYVPNFLRGRSKTMLCCFENIK